MTGEAAAYMTEVGVKAVGVDAISLDAGGSEDFPAHRHLLQGDIPGFENMNNVHKLPPRGSTIFAAPMLINRGSGAPTRAFAIGWQGYPAILCLFRVNPSRRAGLVNGTMYQHPKSSTQTVDLPILGQITSFALNYLYGELRWRSWSLAEILYPYDYELLASKQTLAHFRERPLCSGQDAGDQRWTSALCLLPCRPYTCPRRLLLMAFPYHPNAFHTATARI